MHVQFSFTLIRTILYYVELTIAYLRFLFDFSTANFDFETLVIKQLKMEAFVASEWIDEWFAVAEKIRDWILEVSTIIIIT